MSNKIKALSGVRFLLATGIRYFIYTKNSRDCLSKQCRREQMHREQMPHFAASDHSLLIASCYMVV